MVSVPARPLHLPNRYLFPRFQKLLNFHSRTGILSRPTIFDWTKEHVAPPPIASLSHLFRTEGVKLSSSACRKALQEAGLLPNNITHVVAVTSTDQGNPGFDLLVAQTLGLSPKVQRTLLHGVGCAGGLSALRAAADIAAAASQRGRPACVLVVACELCSLFLRAELQAACREGTLHIAPALFSDAAAAVVVCNELALGTQKPVFELNEWCSMVVPGTSEMMSLVTEQNGTQYRPPH
jgi:type III polyketide synthase